MPAAEDHQELELAPLPWQPPSPAPDQWTRVVLVHVKPSIDGGRWPIQRSLGEDVEVEAGVIVDGHEKLGVELISKPEGGAEEVRPMPLRYNDEYVAAFPCEALGFYQYRVRAWLDQFGTWADQFERRVEGGADQAELKSELLDGASILKKACERASGADRKTLDAYVARFESGEAEAALEPKVAELARQYDPREGSVESDWLGVRVGPRLGRFSTWYEFFPRSAGANGQPGTLDDAAKLLPRIKDLGFDVVYLPPIHPIGEQFRKGKDNSPTAQPGEPGSPWAIGGKLEDGTLGGHKSVHPELGGIEAFDRFVEKADGLGLHVALDIAFQTSPDHPYVKEHPEWFRHRPDGTIRYAENPPKKYQDVYPFDFETQAWESLWDELKSVFTFWIDHGVKVFRVDNPHTKPFAFWEWCIGELRNEHPDIVFLAEAFSRPKIMYTLAKLGYNQSYTYFAWRNTKEELTSYGEELFNTEVGEYYRPNFWPNTPDILTDYLVHGGRPGHVIRYVLAGTLSSCTGIYGPPYEHVYNHQHPDREEYQDNEKYEVRSWNWYDPTSLQPLMRRVNRIRHQNPALQQMRNIRFVPVDNDQIIAYAKWQGDNLILTVVNLDPHNAQAGWLNVPLDAFGMAGDAGYGAHDLLGGERYHWHGPHNFVRLDPHVLPAHILRIER